MSNGAPMLLSWCPQDGDPNPDDPCFPCKPKPVIPKLPSKVGGGPWPVTPPNTAYRVWYYFIQLTMDIHGNLDGGAILLGWGGIIYSPTGASAFGWAWPNPPQPQPMPPIPSEDGTYVSTSLDFFDGGAAGGTVANPDGTEAHFSSFADAQTQVGSAFSNYYYGY